MMTEFWQNKKILVTGGGGFIGSHFVEQLVEMGAKVRCVFLNKNKVIDQLRDSFNSIDFISADLTMRTQLDKLCKGMDIIINCAALDGNLEFKRENAALILDTNIRIISNILDCALKSGIKQVVNLSSGEVYPLSVESPISEKDDNKRTFKSVDNGYAVSKRYGELLCRLYEKQYKIEAFLPRPTNTYGPRDHFEQESSRVIPTMVKKVLRGEEIEIWGDGKQKRGFIYVKDLVYAVLRMVEVGKYRVLNIGTDEDVSIIQLANLVSKLCRIKAKLKFNKSKTSTMKKRLLDVSKLYSILDFEPRSLEAGLRETIDWYKNNR